MTLSPIHHAMARAMPVSGGPPCRAGDTLCWHDGGYTNVRFVEWLGGTWRVNGGIGILPGDRIRRLYTSPPSGGFGMVRRPTVALTEAQVRTALAEGRKVRAELEKRVAAMRG